MKLNDKGDLSVLKQQFGLENIFMLSDQDQKQAAQIEKSSGELPPDIVPIQVGYNLIRYSRVEKTNMSDSEVAEFIALKQLQEIQKANKNITVIKGCIVAILVIISVLFFFSSCSAMLPYIN